MEHPFFPTTPTRADALRWLSVSEKLLYSRDLFGSKSLATRARDADPTLTHADQLLAVVDTLIAGDRRVGNNKHDWYSILRVPPSRGRDVDHQIAANYRSLGVLLNPQVNKYPYADQACKLMVDAWRVLSNPSSKDSYDREIGLLVPTHPDPFLSSQQNHPIMSQNQNPMPFAGVEGSSGANFPGVGVNAVHQRIDPLDSSSTQATHSFRSFGSSNQVTQGFMSFSPGSIIGFGPTGGGGTAYSEASNDGYSSSFAFNSNISNQDLGNFGGGNPHSNGPADVDRTNGKSVNRNRNINSDGIPKAVESSGIANTRTPEHQNGPTAMNMEGNAERVNVPEETNKNLDVESFWTACPYCYYMYEYPRIYVDCTLRCQQCKRAFQGVAISSPPMLDGKDSFFCCWGFLPLGFSMANWEKNEGNIPCNTPFIPVRRTRAVDKNARSWVYIDDDDEAEASDASFSSGDDWDGGEEKATKAKKNVRARKVNGAKPNTRSGNKKEKVSKGKQKVVEEDDEVVVIEAEEASNEKTTETGNKRASVNPRKQPARAVKNFGKLDLNVEFSNEAEDSGSKAVQGNQGTNEGVDDTIEGTGFFEGLDEFLNSLPILNAEEDDDDKAAKGP